MLLPRQSNNATSKSQPGWNCWQKGSTAAEISVEKCSQENPRLKGHRRQLRREPYVGFCYRFVAFNLQVLPKCNRCLGLLGVYMSSHILYSKANRSRSKSRAAGNLWTLDETCRFWPSTPPRNNLNKFICIHPDVYQHERGKINRQTENSISSRTSRK